MTVNRARTLGAWLAKAAITVGALAWVFYAIPVEENLAQRLFSVRPRLIEQPSPDFPAAGLIVRS